MKYALFFILYAICSRIQVELIGTLSIADIFTLFAFLYLLFCGKISFAVKSDKELVTVTKLYVLLIFIELFAELLVGNELVNVLKSLAINIFSYTKLLFFWIVLGKHISAVKWFLVGTIIATIIFVDPESEADIDAIINGEQFSFFKFSIAPAIFNGLVAFSLLKGKQKLHVIFILVGVIDIILGARSTGLMTMMTGVVAFMINNSRTQITKKQLIRWCIIGCLIVYPVFVIYVNAVLSGEIISGNSRDQFQHLSNPYNPIYALLSGRKESPAAIAAILDSPWIGWGAWAEDPGWKYHKILAMFQGEMFDIREFGTDTDIIPAHSVLLQTGVHNGIFALLVMGSILWFFIRRGASAIYKNSPYLYLLIYSLSQLIWNGLFSPLSHFRGLFPFYFFCCLYAYKQKKLGTKC